MDLLYELKEEIPSNPVTSMSSFFWAWNLPFCASIWNRWQMDAKMGHSGFSVTCHLCQGWEMSIHEDPPSSAYHVIFSCWYHLVNTEGLEFSGPIFSSLTATVRRLARGLWAELETLHPLWKGWATLWILYFFVSYAPQDQGTNFSSPACFGSRSQLKVKAKT